MARTSDTVGTSSRRVVVAMLLLLAPAPAPAHGEYSEQAQAEKGFPGVAAMVIGISTIPAAGNVYAIVKGERYLGWVISGFIAAGFCAEVGLPSLMYGKIGLQYGALFLATSAALAVLSRWNLHLPRQPDPSAPYDGLDDEPDDGPTAALVPLLLPDATGHAPGVALMAAW